MQLIIMRHGEAGWHSLDQERELTVVGRHGAAAVAAAIGKSSWRPDRICCSPYTRAGQAAAIVSVELNCPVDEKAFITADADPGLCLGALLETDISRWMLVSDMPLVGSLSTVLVEGHRKGIPFMTAQAVVLDMPVVGPGCADLKEQFLP